MTTEGKPKAKHVKEKVHGFVCKSQKKVFSSFQSNQIDSLLRVKVRMRSTIYPALNHHCFVEMCVNIRDQNFNSSKEKTLKLKHTHEEP